jgi:hypothetical protein
MNRDRAIEVGRDRLIPPCEYDQVRGLATSRLLQCPVGAIGRP